MKKNKVIWMYHFTVTAKEIMILSYCIDEYDEEAIDENIFIYPKKKNNAIWDAGFAQSAIGKVIKGMYIPLYKKDEEEAKRILKEYYLQCIEKRKREIEKYQQNIIKIENI